MGRAMTTALLLLILPVLILSSCDDPAGPEGEPQDGVLFISNRSGTYDSYDIFRMNADGSDVRNLTDMPGPSYGPLSVSPQGDRVVFASGHEYFIDIYVMDVEGEERLRLTGADPQEDLDNHFPHWSPDGSMIAFATLRERTTAGWAVYVMNADGSNPRNVAPSLTVDCCNGGSIPIAWTPDGRVAFQHYDGEEVRYYTVHPDGTGLDLLLQSPDGYGPRWSPDGSLIAFARDSSVHIMNSDGSDVRRLSRSATGIDRFPGSFGWSLPDRSWPAPWSPDGTRIVFENWRLDGTLLYVIDADGADLQEVTERGDVRFTGWGWSTDGERILYTKRDADGADVYAVRPDGTGRTSLTNSPTDDEHAVWVPRSP